MDRTLEEKRIAAYRAAPDDIKALYSNPIIGETISVHSEGNLEETMRRAAIDTVGDVILGFYEKNELPKLLVSNVGVPETVAQKISAGLSSALSPVAGKPPLPEANPELKERLHLRPETAQPEQSGAPKPLTREELMNSLSAKRTMADDIEAVRKRENKPEQTPPVRKSAPQKTEPIPERKGKSSIPWYKKPLIDEE